MRIAGGWVRDKILQLQSHDIDIAVEGMTGLEFARELNEYLSKHGHKIQDIGVIRENPEKSKLLETATVRVLEY